MCGLIFVPAANSKLQARENARDRVVREGEGSGARTDGTGLQVAIKILNRRKIRSMDMEEKGTQIVL
jgi:hypothetical protein